MVKEQNVDEEWGRRYKRLVVWAMKKGFGKEEAKDLAQAAISQFLGGKTPVAEVDIMRALGSRLNGEARNRRTKKVDRAVQPTLDGEVGDGASGQDLERQIVSRDLAGKLVGGLLDRVDRDEVVSSLVLLIVEGVEQPGEQAERLGVDVREVYKARRRLVTHVAALTAELEGK
jgi:hypothetical protein